MFVRVAREAAPDIDPAHKWIWRAWHRLNLDRPWVAGGLGPARPLRIPWAAVRQWADYNGLDAEDASFLDHCIVGMDEEYLNHHAELVKKELGDK